MVTYDFVERFQRRQQLEPEEGGAESCCDEPHGMNRPSQPWMCDGEEN